jgi:hypothetical protein
VSNALPSPVTCYWQGLACLCLNGFAVSNALPSPVTCYWQGLHWTVVLMLALICPVTSYFLADTCAMPCLAQ